MSTVSRRVRRIARRRYRGNRPLAGARSVTMYRLSLDGGRLSGVLLWVACWFAPGGVFAQDKPPEAAPTPAQRADALLDAVAEKYGAMASYRDEGVLEVRAQDPETPIKVEITFSTAFSRPERMRVDWTEKRSRARTGNYVLAVNGASRALYWGELKQYEQPQSLLIALTEASGLSYGAAGNIPNLLQGKHAVGSVLRLLSNKTIEREEPFDGVHCVVLSGEAGRLGTYRVWIGKEDLLIRKLEQRPVGYPAADEPPAGQPGEEAGVEGVPSSPLPKPASSYAVVEIHRNIRVDIPVEEETFAFVPPEGVRLVARFAPDQ